MTFVPFDATDEELTELQIVRQAIPPEMEAPLLAWIKERLKRRSMAVTATDYANLSLVHDVQAALRIQLGAPASGSIDLDRILGAIYAQGERTIMRVTDFLLSQLPSSDAAEATALARTLDWANCKYKVDQSGSAPRLALRLSEGVSEVAQSTVDASGEAGRLLYKAWQYAFGVDPQPAEAMDFAVKAAERAITPVVCPKHAKPSLGNAVAYVRDQKNWHHNLSVDGDKAPPNDLLYGLLQTLWAGQHYRHVDQAAVAPTLAQAQAHVQLAALLVGWFSSGIVTQDRR